MMPESKLHVLHLSAPTALAGAERVMLTFLNKYDRQKFSVSVGSYLNLNYQDNLFTKAVENLDIPLIKILVGRNNLPSELWQTINIIRNNNVDLLHTHGYRSDISGFFAAKYTGIPIVSTLHGWTPISSKLRAYEAIDRWCLKKFDKVICVSKVIYNALSLSGFSDNKLTYLHNAVSLEQADSPCNVKQLKEEMGWTEDDTIILSVGRLSPEKGLRVLLSAFQKKYSDSEHVKLVIVGDGPLRSELEEFSKELDIAKRVVFTGHRDNVQDYYKMANLFVMPSFTEGFPMALLEAMQAGLPVVATKVGGIPDIIESGVNGLMIEPDNIKCLGDAMQKILSDAELTTNLSLNAKHTIQNNYSAEPWAKQIESIYNDVYELFHGLEHKEKNTL